MKYSAAMLDQIVPGDHIFRIVIFYAFQRPVFLIFSIDAVHDRHSDLDVRIIRIAAAQNKVTFQFPDSTNTDIITFGTGVGINDVLQSGTVIDSFICIKS